MTVDPSDSSYTPSVVVTSVGESLQSLVEIKTTHVKENDHSVKLLENVQEVG
jgi:E3 ubiquitin-protein ligase HERC2